MRVLASCHFVCRLLFDFNEECSGWNGKVTLLRSTFLLTVVLVILFDALFAFFRPLRFFDVTEFIPLEQNPLVFKLRTFLDNRSYNPQILMLGSSLILFPSTRTDEEMDSKPHRYDNWYIRHRVSADTVPRYFTRQLEDKLHTKIEICNLGVQGSIVSDQLLILRKALEWGKKPKVVILELAPRSFLDNMHKQIRNTPVFQVLGDFATAPPFWKEGRLNKEALATIPGLISYFYRVKADYRSLICNIVASALNRPMNNWEAENSIRRRKPISLVNPEMEWQASEKPLGPKYSDLPMYDTIYNPPDPAFFEAEKADCLNLLAQAKSAGVSVIVADMPISSPNRLLLDKGYQEKYRQFIKYLEDEQKVPVVHLSGSSEISDTDFEDSAHLNASGGKKLFAALTRAIQAGAARNDIVLKP